MIHGYRQEFIPRLTRVSLNKPICKEFYLVITIRAIYIEIIITHIGLYQIIFVFTRFHIN